jgi:tetratricopeptide (TPR) repeat protein
LYDQGERAYRNRKYDRAISSFTAILQTKLESRITAVIYVARAQTFTAKGEFKRAIADATEAIRLNPRFSLAYNARGVAYGNMGDTTKSISDFDAALRLDPNSKDAQRNRALAQSRKKY